MASGINIYSFFQISEIIIPAIWKNYFGYPKIGTYFRYLKKLFWISKTTISDIRKETNISDIQNSYYGYPK